MRAATAEPDITYWKRRVVQSCVYGVDLNPLAVDLAKLSLWLSTLASDRPLSFLDHHLRTGNALVGARLDELARVREGKTAAGKKPETKMAHESGEASGQLTLLADDTFRQSMSLAVGNLWLIEASGAESVDDVKQQETLYQAARDAFTKKWEPLADLTTATHFGVSVTPGLWKPLADFALGRAITAPPAFVDWMEEAARAARARRFFHWELEFPEVFFDQQGRPLGDAAGFDAVVGNPPYVRQELLAPFKPFLKETFAAYHSVADLYLYFFEQGLRLLQRGGRMAFISSGTFARANFAKSFRAVLPTLGALETIIDFGENQPFVGAEMVRPSIVVLWRGAQEGPFRSLFLSGKVPESLADAVVEEGVNLDADALSQPEWSFQSSAGTELLAKLQSAGRKLVDVVDGKMYRGVLTGLNEAFIINTPTRDRLVAEDADCTDLIKPVLRGEDLRPWYQEDEGRWLIFTRRGVDIERYPSLKNYLEQFRAGLEPRVPGADEAAPGRKPGVYKWYEIQDSVDYFAAIDRPKIFWPDIAKLPRFSWGEPGQYIGNTGYIIPDPDPALLGFLQSRACWYALSQTCQPLRLRAGLWQYRVLPQFISRLIVPDMMDTERAAIGALARTITDTTRARYALHEKVRHRILSDLGTPAKPLNQKLTAWWTLTFAALHAELVNVFRQDIPLKDRDDWEIYLAARQAEHARHTQAIVQNETELNARVYALFDLTPGEIETIEDSTKYRYGEV